MLDVAGGGEQGDRVVAGERDEPTNGVGCRSVAQLGAVAAGELLEPLDAMAVPASKVGAWRGIPHPFIQGYLGLGDAPRPQTIDEDAIAGRTSVVHTMKLHAATSGHPSRSSIPTSGHHACGSSSMCA